MKKFVDYEEIELQNAWICAYTFPPSIETPVKGIGRDGTLYYRCMLKKILEHDRTNIYKYQWVCYGKFVDIMFWRPEEYFKVKSNTMVEMRLTDIEKIVGKKVRIIGECE